MIVDFLAYKENRILDEIEMQQTILELYDTGNRERLNYLNSLWNEVRTQNVSISNAAGYAVCGIDECIISTHVESFTPEIFELEGIPTHDTLCPSDGGGEFPTLETPSITPIRIKSRRKFNWKRIWAWMGF